jgi:hypothetical protein
VALPAQMTTASSAACRIRARILATVATRVGSERAF